MELKRAEADGRSGGVDGPPAAVRLKGSWIPWRGSGAGDEDPCGQTTASSGPPAGTKAERSTLPAWMFAGTLIADWLEDVEVGTSDFRHNPF